MYREKLVKVPIYNVKLKFITTDSLIKLFRKTGIDKKEEIFASTFEYKITKKGKDYHCIFVVLNPNYSYSKLTLGTLVHELSHVKNYIFERLAIIPNVTNDENEAYLMGYLTDKAFEFYKKDLRL